MINKLLFCFHFDIIYLTAGLFVPDIINNQNKKGETALWTAVHFFSTGFRKMLLAAAILLNASADPNIASNTRSMHGIMTPLDIAEKFNNIPTIRLLLVAGAEPSLMSCSCKGRRWLEKKSIVVKSKILLLPRAAVDYVSLVEDEQRLIGLTFTQVEYDIARYVTYRWLSARQS